MNEIFSSTQHFVQNRAAGASRDNRVYQGNRNAASALGSVICLFQSKVSAIGREAPDLRLVFSPSLISHGFTHFFFTALPSPL